MVDKTVDLRRVLSMAGVYSLFQWLVGAPSARRRLIEEHVRPQAGDRILDIGCGTAAILVELVGTDYVGFDPNPSYVSAALERFGTRGEFIVGAVSDPPSLIGDFDLVLAVGVLHHIDDQECASLVSMAGRLLRPGGRLITFDPVVDGSQSRVAKFVVKRDRGEFVRTRAEYRALAGVSFENVTDSIYHDVLRIPYSHLVMDCR